MNTKRFTVDNDGMKIQGIAYLPANSTDPAQVKKSPAIIMSHGYLSNLHNFEYFATQFAMIGYNVFTFNFCCGSDETDTELMSDGTTTNLCIEGEISDLIAVYNYVSTRDYVKSDEIILWGESQGAFVSGLTAARLQEKISKLVMIFPAVCIPDHARRGTLGGASYDPKNPPELIYTERAMLSKVFVDDVKDMDAYSELAKYKGETLLIQGTCDSIVVPEYQYIVKKEFDLTDNIENENAQITNANHRLKFQMVRGMDHYTGGEHKEALKDSIRYFIEGKEEIFSFRIIVTNVVVTDDSGRCDYLVELIVRQEFAYLLMAVLVKSDLGSHENSDAGDVLPCCPDFSLLGGNIEYLPEQVFLFRLYSRNEKVAMVGKAQSSKPFGLGLKSRLAHRCPLSVERELAVIVIVVKSSHQLSPSMFPSITSILRA